MRGTFPIWSLILIVSVSLEIILGLYNPYFSEPVRKLVRLKLKREAPLKLKYHYNELLLFVVSILGAHASIVSFLIETDMNLDSALKKAGAVICVIVCILITEVVLTFLGTLAEHLRANRLCSLARKCGTVIK